MMGGDWLADNPMTERKDFLYVEKSKGSGFTKAWQQLKRQTLDDTSNAEGNKAPEGVGRRRPTVIATGAVVPAPRCPASC